MCRVRESVHAELRGAIRMLVRHGRPACGTHYPPMLTEGAGSPHLLCRSSVPSCQQRGRLADPVIGSGPYDGRHSLAAQPSRKARTTTPRTARTTASPRPQCFFEHLPLSGVMGRDPAPLSASRTSQIA